MVSEDIIITTEFERKELRKQRIIILSGDIDIGTAHEFIEDITILTKESKEPITVIITSPGGSAFAGFAVVRAIRYAQRHGVKVIGSVYGQAMSMAFYILQCCDIRKMGNLCILMAHGVTTGFVGDMRNVDAEKKLLTMWQTELAKLVSERCTNKNHKACQHDYWVELLRDNTPQFYSASESLEMGLVDKVYDDGENEENSPECNSTEKC